MPVNKSCCLHLGIATNNPNALVDFYINVLGFKKEKEGKYPPDILNPLFNIEKDCYIISLIKDKMKIEIFSVDKSYFKTKVENSIGFNHWAYFVEDKNNFCNELKNKKISIIEVKKNENSIFFIKDPDGNRIEIVEYES